MSRVETKKGNQCIDAGSKKRKNHVGEGNEEEEQVTPGAPKLEGGTGEVEAFTKKKKKIKEKKKKKKKRL